MGWRETCVVKERMRFAVAVEKKEESFAAVCRRYGVSRKTGYKWMERFRLNNPGSLEDRSRAPLRHPQAVSGELAEECLAVRRRHPSWGPVKVRAWLDRQRPGVRWPATSTIGALFDEAGLTVKRRVRHRSPPATAPFAQCSGANDVWCMDFKGWFRTGDGSRCEALTLCDAHSRYLLRCQGVARCNEAHVWPVLDAAFREYGLPKALRSDNGPPFASSSVGGLSRLSVKIIKAGVRPERIEPGKPQQNGRLERLHLTLLQDTADPPAHSLRQQLRRFKDFQDLYNEERPHQALGNDVPAEHYAPSPRTWEGVLRAPSYSLAHQVRYVRQNGEIKWQGHLIFVSEVLIGEPVGLIESDAGWLITYGPIELGVIAYGSDRLRRPKTRRGLVDNASALPTKPTAQQQQQQEQI